MSIERLEELIRTDGPEWLRDEIAYHMTPADDETAEEADDFETAFERVYELVCEVAASPSDSSYLGGWGPSAEQIKVAKASRRVLRKLLKQVGLAKDYSV